MKVALFNPELDNPETSESHIRLKPKILYAPIYADPETIRFEQTFAYISQYPIAEELYGVITRPQWTPKQVELAEFYAQSSLNYPKIKGIFIDDLLDQLKQNQLTIDKVKTIIANAKSINPSIKIQTTYYPHWGENPSDINQFNIDEIWFSCNSPEAVENLGQWLDYAKQVFEGKNIWGGINPRSEFAGFLNNEQWEYALRYYKQNVNVISIYSSKNLDINPELIDIAEPILATTPISPFLEILFRIIGPISIGLYFIIRIPRRG